MGWWARLFGRGQPPGPDPASAPGQGEDPRGDDDGPDSDDGFEIPEVIAMAVTDELDLHHFHPREIADLVSEYLDEAQRLGLVRVRLIHGKGIGNLRRTVHATLDRHPAVDHYQLADERAGSWGATLVELRPRSRD